ncbi:hypothetical protein [Atribacter sp.]
MRLPRHYVPRNDGVGGRDCHVTTFLAMTEWMVEIATSLRSSQ